MTLNDSVSRARPGVLLMTGLTLLVGLVLFITPRPHDVCPKPLPLNVAPGETSRQELAYCLYEVPIRLLHGPYQADKQTAWCARSKADALMLRAEMTTRRAEAHVQCLATVPGPLDTLRNGFAWVSSLIAPSAD